MAKHTLREIWSVAKDEPLYRVLAAIFAIAVLIWFGSYVSHLVGVWRMMDRSPYPSTTAVYRLNNGRCISFASLPKGWKPARGGVYNKSFANLPPGVAVWQDIDGVDYLSMMSFGDNPRRRIDEVSDMRLPELDVPPYNAWQGVDRSLVYLNGEKDNYTRYLVCSTPDYREKKRRVPTCDLHEDDTDPPGLSMSVNFPLRLMGKADAVIAESKAVLQRLESSCEGAIAPPR
jgi:hypothetical protein